MNRLGRRFCVRLIFRTTVAMFLAFALVLGSGAARADEPYSRTKDYDLQNVRVHLRFDVDQKKLIGEVTHTLSIARPTSTS